VTTLSKHALLRKFLKRIDVRFKFPLCADAEALAQALGGQGVI